MILHLPRIRGLFAFAKLKDLFYLLLFLFFFTLHADQLSLTFSSLTFRLNNFLALFVLLLFFLRKGILLLKLPRKLFIALCFLSLSFFLSALLSLYPRRSFLFLLWYGYTALFYFYLPYLMMTYLDERKVLRLYFLSFLLVGLYGFSQLFFSFFRLYDPFAHQSFFSSLLRPSGFAYEPSYLALYLTPFVVMANLHYLLHKERDFFLFSPLTLLKVLVINFLYLATTSTGTVFAYGIFILVLIFSPLQRFFPQLKRAALRLSLSVVLGAILLLALFPQWGKNFFFKFFFTGFMSHHSFYERWIGIVNSWKIFLAHPLFGIGPGSFSPYMVDKWRAKDAHYIFPPDQFLEKADNIFKCFEPSNVLTEVLASLGLIGLIAFCAFIYGYYRLAKERLSSHEITEERKALILLFLISSFVMLVVLQFNQGLFRTYIWAHLGLAVAYTSKK